MKDISKIGRNLEKTIIIDNVAENFALQPDNGIFIQTWYNDQHDGFLTDLVPLLKRKSSSIGREFEDDFFILEIAITLGFKPDDEGNSARGRGKIFNCENANFLFSIRKRNGKDRDAAGERRPCAFAFV